MAYAFVRNLKTQGGANLRTLAQISSAQIHAKRQDLAGPRRQRLDGDHRPNHSYPLSLCFTAACDRQPFVVP